MSEQFVLAVLLHGFPDLHTAKERVLWAHLSPGPCSVGRQVLGVYSGRQWSLIEEHLHDALGRQAREGDDATGAVRHFMAMLVCPSNNLYCQQLYLTQFMDALRTAQAQLVGAGSVAEHQGGWLGSLCWSVERAGAIGGQAALVWPGQWPAACLYLPLSAVLVISCRASRCRLSCRCQKSTASG